MKYDEVDIVMVDPLRLTPHPRRDEAGIRYDSTSSLADLPPKQLALRIDILEHGIRDALLVQADTYYIISGHFRRAIAMDAHFPRVPIRLLQISDDEAYVRMMAENWQRNDMITRDHMAVAKNYFFLLQRLRMDKDVDQSGWNWNAVPVNNYSLTSEEAVKVAKMSEVTPKSIRNYFQLLKLTKELQEWVSIGIIGLHGGVALSTLPVGGQRDFYDFYHISGKMEPIPDQIVKAFPRAWKESAEKEYQRATGKLSESKMAELARLAHEVEDAENPLDVQKEEILLANGEAILEELGGVEETPVPRDEAVERYVARTFPDKPRDDEIQEFFARSARVDMTKHEHSRTLHMHELGSVVSRYAGLTKKAGDEIAVAMGKAQGADGAGIVEHLEKVAMLRANAEKLIELADRISGMEDIKE
jgi:hypothetical protein